MMLSIERYEIILNKLETDKAVKVSQLSQLLGVTEKTVRIDLEALEEKGLLKRIHGGAVLENKEGEILPVSERQSSKTEIKDNIAREAVRMIEPHETILMDGGSTTSAISERLGDFPVTVITNDIKIAYILNDKENVQLVVLGGTRIPHSSSLLGDQATEALKRLRVNRLFFGTTGFSIEHGLTVLNSLHADWKRKIIDCADHITLVADSTKFEKIALVQFAEITNVSELITDDQLDHSSIKEIENKGVNVRVARKKR
ncbi:DeoR/GlpR family DNA-binding transcription regulator [Halobacillus shinanisalinarum]|uniref:DeoR/GlpR family DNA-binding transcription regulator n=1 Tax=Halobacillus shinanisalinarum TaxID=2932258 RepID=A0ABY4GYU5_9BACI|nr:DeoR/GlpR family DNA-binding transcription regulator [Halobacillus shinanisalinarum]UOQ93343.1 DeoR/GlpR family DNA-binding transcription regulator [Halobacillus shinanisalinarum]